MRSLCVVLLALSSLHAADFYLKDGDRVVFYGDSITDQRLYTTFVESYAVTRFPQRDIAFVNSGWGGDRVSGGGGGPVDVRLWRDVYAYRPTVMTVMLGMNDGRYRAFDQLVFDEYAKGMRHIVSSVKRAFPGVRMTLIQPSPYDDVTRAPLFEGGYNAVLVRYGQFVKELAADEKADVADLNASVVAALERARSINAEKAPDLIRDRVHPGAGGHLLMAAALLKAWGAPPLVSRVEIDGARGVLRSAENARVEQMGKGGLRWTQTDEALPMPLDLRDEALKLALASSDFLDTLNQQLLRVSGLKPGSYALRIDGEGAGTFTAEQLANGVNLATLPTPMLRQALTVHDLTLKHNNIHFARWRQVQVPLERENLDTAAEAMRALDVLERELIARQKAAAKPKPHTFELVAVSGT